MDYDTAFKNNLIKKFREKGLSESSIKMYIRNLEKLNDDKPLKNLNFLKDENEIIQKLNNYKDNTKRGYIISICSAYTAEDNKKNKKIYDKYFNILVNMNKTIKNKEKENEATPTQSENWIKWEEVEKIFNDLRDKVAKFTSHKEINEANYNLLLSYLILSLYYYIPPRRNLDYQLMNIIKADEPDLSTNYNYLDYENKEFIFNKFKTSKTEGQQRQKIPDDLYDIINLYLKYHPIIKGKKLTKNNNNIAFLVYYDGRRLDKINSITRILNKIFKKSIGASMLRHIYLTHKYGDTLEEQKKDADAMGHSIEQQKDYIKINN